MTINNSSYPIAVALLGTGYIADYHAKALRGLPQVSVKAVCDLNSRLAKQFSERHGIPKFYTDLADMLSSESLDVVHILTPPNIHYKTASQVLAAGVDVFIEKPLCSRLSDCQSLRQQADEVGRRIGVSHNFLYFPAYEKLVSDIRDGRLGKIDQIDIIWNKELGQLQGGPFGAWMLQGPKNILFEVAPHSFAHLVHLIGLPDSISVEARDRIELPRGLEFYRKWEVQGWQGNTSIRLRFSFIEGYSEHYVQVRGSNASAFVDFENNLYVCEAHTPNMLDVDRFLRILNIAKASTIQATSTLSNFLLTTAKLSKVGEPFQHSITRTVESFYQTRQEKLDERINANTGEAAVALAEWVARTVQLPEPVNIATPISEVVPPLRPSNVLVLGGTGFIGQALVHKLHEAGHGVRLLCRDPNSCPADLRNLGIELAKGDFNVPESIATALDGIEYFYHLARGSGQNWNDYYNSDVKPTHELAKLCLSHGVKRLFYTSSIAIYYAGSRETTITEATRPHSGILRVAPYARAKAENEQLLMQMHREQGLPVVIFRPGIVLGPGGNPRHLGVANWPYKSVCQLWGNGNNKLPIVLVEDVADALVKAIDVPGIDGESYNLASQPCITANDYLNELEAVSGLKFSRVEGSPLKDYLQSLAKWAVKSVGRDPNVAFPSYADSEGRSFSAVFSFSKAQQQLGWHPIQDRQVLIDKGIRQPVAEFIGTTQV